MSLQSIPSYPYGIADPAGKNTKLAPMPLTRLLELLPCRTCPWIKLSWLIVLVSTSLMNVWIDWVSDMYILPNNQVCKNLIHLYSIYLGWNSMQMVLVYGNYVNICVLQWMLEFYQVSQAWSQCPDLSYLRLISLSSGMVWFFCLLYSMYSSILCLYRHSSYVLWNLKMRIKRSMPRMMQDSGHLLCLKSF